MKGKRQGSVMVAVLCIFVLVAAFSLIIFQLSLNNLQQAKIQEENMHAYYLAYSGCELTYAALVEENKSNWNSFVSGLSDSPIPNHKLHFTMRGTEPEPGYTGIELKNLGEMEDITVQVTKVPDSPSDQEIEFKGWLKIEAVGRTNIKGQYAGLRTKYLYVSPEKYYKHFWR